MKRIKVGISMGLQGCQIEDEIDIEDDATPKEIEAEAREWAFGHIDWWFEDVATMPNKETHEMERPDDNQSERYRDDE